MLTIKAFYVATS